MARTRTNRWRPDELWAQRRAQRDGRYQHSPRPSRREDGFGNRWITTCQDCGAVVYDGDPGNRAGWTYYLGYRDEAMAIHERACRVNASRPEHANMTTSHSQSSTRAETWFEYVHAAERKVAMAHYHLDCLGPEIEDFAPPIPIPLQAHFEGVLYCADAAGDQVTQALIQRFDMSRHAALHDERNRTLPVVVSLVEGRPGGAALQRWSWEPILGDARLLRNRATHAYYTKSQRLEVERVRGSQYRGTRQLGPYCVALVNHLDRLLPLFADLDASG